MAQIFKAKTLVSSTGRFSHEATAPNLVYNTGDQTISGNKTFATGVNINGHVGIGINNNNFGLYVRKSSAGGVNPDGDSIAVFEGSGNSHITVLASNAQSAGVVLGSPADNFGAYLTWNHDNNSLKLATANPNGFIQLLTNNEAEAVRITSGANVGIGTTSPSEKLQVVGNILANNLVYNTGDQTISGNKTFNNDVVFTGTAIFNEIDLSDTDSILLSGIDIQIVSGSMTLTNPPTISGNPFITGNLALYATTINLATTGSTLDTKINNLSGYIKSTSSNIVFTTGDQAISGNKTFIGRTLISGKSDGFAGETITLVGGNGAGFGGGINLIGGIGSTIFDGSVNVNANIAVNRDTNKNSFTDFYKSGDAGTPYLSISKDQIQIKNGATLLVSGVAVTPALYATITNVGLTGVTLNTRITNLSGYINSTSSNIVFTTGNQNIGGNKTFTGVTTFSGQQVNLIDTALSLSGVGDMTFEGTNINFINSPVFISGTNLRVSGDVLANNLNNLVYTTGNQIISGIKTFIGNHNISGNLNVTGNSNMRGNSILQGDLTVSGNTTITGHLSAASKSFLIDHPTQVGKKLQYGSLESPYHGIRLTDKNKISAEVVKVYLPEYISSLVNDDKVNIQLTNINHDKNLFVKEVDVNENNFTIGMNRGWFDKNEYEFYWSFTAERKDIPKLTVEF